MNFKTSIENNAHICAVATAADELGLETYIVGGFVRDLIMDRDNKDIDFVCMGSGIDLAQKVASNMDGNAKVHIFKTFGTAMINSGEMELEFVGARKESYDFNSRKPTVESGTLEDDQLRRDFTINALAICLNKERFGELVDPFDGVGDIKRKVIKTPQDALLTLSDDPLRIIRAIRFATQLNFDIDAATFQAITTNKDRLKIVSMERISQELNKIISAATPSYGFKLLYVSGVLKDIFPEFVALHGVQSIDNKSHKDNFYHTLQVLDNVAKVSDDLWLRWAAILHDIAKPLTKRFVEPIGWTFHGHEDKGARMVPGIFRKLRLPLNEKMDMVAKLVRLHLRPISLVKDEVTDSAVRRLMFEAGEHFLDLMILCRADVTSKNNSKVKRYLENFDKVERKVVEVEEKENQRMCQPVVKGEDIMQTFDLKPSKVIGDIKADMIEAILEGEIVNDYEVLFPFMVKLAERKYGLKPKAL
jgi:putative nucleotidyltransferase with HDIG domain